MTAITDPEVSAFRTAGTRTGKLAYTADDGRPLVAPVWFIADGGNVVFNTGKGSAKGRALARDPRRPVRGPSEQGNHPLRFPGAGTRPAAGDRRADSRTGGWGGAAVVVRGRESRCAATNCSAPMPSLGSRSRWSGISFSSPPGRRRQAAALSTAHGRGSGSTSCRRRPAPNASVPSPPEPGSCHPVVPVYDRVSVRRPTQLAVSTSSTECRSTFQWPGVQVRST
jgi:Pyridoxamine 5'-phosphate oxidase